MAISKTVKLHASSSVPPLAGAYLVIDKVDYSRLARTLSLSLACFASKADREKVKAAFDAHAEATQALLDNKAIANKPIPGQDEGLAEARAARAKAIAAVVDAQEIIEASIVTLRTASGVTPLGVPLAVNVPPAAIADVLGDDGMPSIAKLYQWLGKQPDYAGAEA